jgi:phosphomethylpyrimidine synthase
MEYVAIRENVNRQQYLENLRNTGPMGEKMVKLLGRQHKGQDFGASIPAEITPSSCARSRPRPRHHPQQHQPPRASR